MKRLSKRQRRMHIRQILNAQVGKFAGPSPIGQDKSWDIRVWEAYWRGTRYRAGISIAEGPEVHLTLTGLRHLIRRLKAVAQRLGAQRAERSFKHPAPDHCHLTGQGCGADPILTGCFCTCAICNGIGEFERSDAPPKSGRRLVTS